MTGFPPEEPLPSSWAGACVRVHPGTGLVSRRGDTLLVVPVLRRAQHDGVGRLVELCHRPHADGRARADELRRQLGLWRAAEAPGFALLVRAGGSLHALVHGPVRILVDGRTPRRPGAEGALVEQVIDDGNWYRVAVAADGETDLPDVDVLPLDLESGTVPGGGVTLDRVPAGRPSTPPATAPAAADLGSAPSSATALRPAMRFRTVLLGECAVRSGAGQAHGHRRPPLPVAGAPGGVGTGSAEPEVLVEGVLCPDGHFTDPEQPTCRTCGRPLPPDRQRERRPRPPLGVVVTDGGTVYAVTGDLVIGREPERAPEVLAGRARPLPLRDAARSTSRVHAHLTVQGWQVVLSDDSSANGTLVSRNGAAGPWLPVTPRGPLALQHGDRVRLGERQLLFDAWRDPVVRGSTGETGPR